MGLHRAKAREEEGETAVGRPPTPGKLVEAGLDLVHLWPHHQSMARCVAVGGARNGELARLFGFTPAAISKIMNSPLFLAEVERIQAGMDQVGLEVRQALEAFVPDALEVVAEDLRESQKDYEGKRIPPSDPKLRELRNKTAFKLLDFVVPTKGPGAQGSLHGGDLHVHLGETTQNLTVQQLRDRVFEELDASGEDN